MRTLAVWGLGVAAAAALAGPGRADDRAARAVVERAVREQGGVDALARAANAARKGKGEFFFDQPVSFTTTETLSLPNRLRLNLTVGTTLLARVLNGEKGWEQVNGTVMEMGRNRLPEVRDEAYVWWVMTLAPLLKDGFDLTPLPPDKVNDRPAVGVKVAAKDRPDCALYFDKETGHLAKIVRRAREGGAAVDKEYLYGDYKAVDGARLPLRETVYVNGRKFSEVSYSDYRLLREADEKAFGKP
jgi:hypothetical protein